MFNKNKKIQLTVDEYISTLKHSFLPTLVIEGNDDLIVFRRLDKNDLSILPVGGRDTVLKLFEKSAEFTNLKCAFVADRDVWVINGIPQEYQSPNLIFTSGYSIENDLIIDGNIESLMTEQEFNDFQEELRIFTCWYALAIEQYLVDNSSGYTKHPNQILDNLEIRAEFEANANNYQSPLFDQLISDYSKLIRGKSLFGLLIRQLSYAGRNPKHNQHALMEVVATAPQALLNQMFVRINQLLS